MPDIELAHLRPTQWTADQIKVYVDQVVSQIQTETDRRFETVVRAQDAAQDVSDRVAQAALRAIEQANEEREKAAEALRRELSEAIRTALESADKLELSRIRTAEEAVTSGDARLHDHMIAQRIALENALVAADGLELSRIKILADTFETYRTQVAAQTAILVKQRDEVTGALQVLLEARIDAVELASSERHDTIRSALEFQLASQKEAITKAEAAAQDKFESHNGLIEQMRQQAVKSEQALATIVGTLLPRETFDSVMAGWQQWRTQIDAGTNKTAGGEIGRQRIERASEITWGKVMPILASVISTVALIAAVIIALNAGP